MTLDFSSLLARIRSNPKLCHYYYDAKMFVDYLIGTKEAWMTARGKDASSGDDVEVSFPYMHRFKMDYVKGMLWRLYQLDDFYHKQCINSTGKHTPVPITMVSFTVYQEGAYTRRVKGHNLSIHESLDLLVDSRETIFKTIRKMKPGLQYYWVMEPHKTGYAHCHVLFFDEFTEDEQSRLRGLWADKYQAGHYQHALEFTTMTDGLDSPRNYLMKYMAKGFNDGQTGSVYGNTEKWSPAELVFNAVMKFSGKRMWGCSNGLQDWIKFDKDKQYDNVVWESVVLSPQKDGGDCYEVWDNESFDLEYQDKIKMLRLKRIVQNDLVGYVLDKLSGCRGSPG